MSGHIVLIGLSGSGKTRVAATLARCLQRPGYDTDALVAALGGASAAVLLRRDEPGFRRLEERAVREACDAPAGVVATGGGAVLSRANRKRLRDGNRVVWLLASQATLLARLDGDTERVLLDGDRAARLRTMERERRPLYGECAEMTVTTDGKTVVQVADEILGRLEETRFEETRLEETRLEGVRETWPGPRGLGG